MQTLIRRLWRGVLAASLSLTPLSVFAQATTPPALPENIQKAIAELESLAQNEIDQEEVVGLSIAIVYQDELIYAKGFGVRDVATQTPVDADTVFQLASVSKPLGSTVVAALVGDGVVTWDSKIHDLDPAFTMYDPWVTREITIRDLYAHRSGLPEHAGDLLEDMGYPRDEVLYRLRFQRPATSFRSHYAYTNFGLAEAAFAAASAAGTPWEQLSEERLYARLGMDSTSSRYADFVARPNRALLHVKEDGQWVQKYERDNDSATPAGGASSSANDMAEWVRLQLAGGAFAGEQVVDAAALAETHHPHMLKGFSSLNGLPGFYGLGWDVGYDQLGRLRLSHSGAFALGAATSVMLAPDAELGIITLSNSFPIGAVEGLNQTFMELALDGETSADWIPLFKQRFSDPAALGVTVGHDYSIPPEAPTPALAADAYVGRYSNDFFGPIEVRAEGDGLVLLQGPQQMAYPLQHYDRDTFTYITTGENAVGASGVTFTITGAGEAATVVVEHLNIHGQGTFVRMPDDDASSAR